MENISALMPPAFLALAIRVAWKPYMFNQGLPHLLGRIETPTLVVRGAEDKVVPASCGQRYLEILPNARAEALEGAGHCVDVERPEALANLITDFVSGG